MDTLTTVLQGAVRSGDHRRVKQLLDMKSFDINSSMSDCLSIAIENFDEEMVKLLLNKGANPELRANNQLSHLWMSFSAMHYGISQLLIKAGANIHRTNFIPFGNGPTAHLIHQAAGCCDDRFVKLLLDRGIPIDQRDSEGDTPLSYSIHNCNTKVTKELISRGANINSRNNAGYTILHLAVMSGEYDLVKQLLNMKADQSNPPDGKGLLHLASMVTMHSGSQVVELLLERGYPVDALDDQGNTPLNCALSLNIYHRTVNVHWNLPRTVKTLLYYGADVHKKNKSCGRSPIKSMTIQMSEINEAISLMGTQLPPQIIMQYAHCIPVISKVLHMRKIGRDMSEEDATAINKHSVFSFLFKNLRQQFEKMEQIIFYPNYSIADVYLMSLHKLTLLFRKENFLDALQNAIKESVLKSFPCYSNQLRDKMDRAIEVSNRLDVVTPHIIEMFQSYLPDLVIEEIIDCVGISEARSKIW